MIIDSHQHFWNYDPIRDIWIDNSMAMLKRNFLPKDLKKIYQINSIEGCVAVQADQSEEETIFLLDQASKNSFIKGVVGWLDIKSSKLNDLLSYYTKYSAFKGLRHIVQNEKDVNFMLKSDFQRSKKNWNTLDYKRFRINSVHTVFILFQTHWNKRVLREMV